MNSENDLNKSPQVNFYQSKKINEKYLDKDLYNDKNSIDNNNYINVKDRISDFKEEINNNKMLNINIKKKNLTKIKINILTKEDNRISYFDKMEKSNENSFTSKISRSSSVKIKLKNCSEEDYNKLKNHLMPIDNKSKHIKNKNDRFKNNINKNKKRTSIIKKNEIIE